MDTNTGLRRLSGLSRTTIREFLLFVL